MSEPAEPPFPPDGAPSSARPIIADFQQRRALDAAIAALADTTSEASLREHAHAIANDYPAPLILPLLIKQLATPSSQLRGGLARLAVLLPREQAVAALRQVAGRRSADPQARMTAAMILERFLDDQIPPALLVDLRSSEDAALQSLREAVLEGQVNRHVLLEYVTQMQAHGEEIAQLVMHHLDGFPAADRVEMLRLIAQDARPRTAQSALLRLEAIAAESPAALRALYTLQQTTPPDQAQAIERALRKLQFRGLRHIPPMAKGWRALLAPAEPAGHLWLWLVRMPAAGGEDGRSRGQTGWMAGLLLHPLQGVLHSFFAEEVEPSFLPAPAAGMGALVDVPFEEGARGRFVEAPFDLGRRLLRLALAAHWEGRARTPLSGEYQLANDLIWQFAPPVVDDALNALLLPPAQGQSIHPPGGAQGATQNTSQEGALHEAARLVGTLLREPAMANWTAPSAAALRDVGLGLPDLGVPDEDLARLMVRELALAPGRDEMLAALAAGLWMQAIYLQVANRHEAAQAAYRLSALLPALPPAQNPLLVALVASALQRLERRREGRARPRE